MNLRLTDRNWLAMIISNFLGVKFNEVLGNFTRFFFFFGLY